MRNIDIKDSNYRKAQIKDAKAITDIVQQTIVEVYPKYYPREIVDFFGQLHCYEHIARDVRKGIVYALEVGDVLVGTGSYEGNHITRVYLACPPEGYALGGARMSICASAVSRKRLWKPDSYKSGKRNSRHASKHVIRCFPSCLQIL